MLFKRHRHQPGVMALLIMSILAGCTGLENAFTERSLNEFRQRTKKANTCVKHFKAIDRITEDTADAKTFRIPGFPYLRINRFLASYAPKKLTGTSFTQWLQYLRRLDRQARSIEFANLPDYIRARHKDLPIKIERCADLFMAVDFKQRHIKEALLQSYFVPDAYNRWSQIAGLYPLSVIPVRFGIMHLHQSQRNDFKQSTVPKNPHRYAPATAQTYDPHTVQAIFRNTNKDALGIPLYNAHDLKILFALFAPVFEIGTESGDDKPGRVTFNTTGRLQIDTKHPAVYHHLAYTRFRGRVLTQLVYTIWFPARTAQHALDIFAGPLDGLMWRVTLDHHGRPMIYDSAHPCGCYHLFFPVRPWSIAHVEQHAFHGEPPVAPIAGPPLHQGQRIYLRLKPGTHYLTSVTAKRTGHKSSHRYRFLEANMLRSLAHPEGRKSLYGFDGLVAESARPERFFLWPMGVASAGTMRQWGHHATAFIGTRHFDDADLFGRILTRRR